MMSPARTARIATALCIASCSRQGCCACTYVPKAPVRPARGEQQGRYDPGGFDRAADHRECAVFHVVHGELPRGQPDCLARVRHGRAVHGET